MTLPSGRRNRSSVTNGNGPRVGATIAVGAAYVLRGPGGGKAGSGAAQGALFTEFENPDQA